MTIPPVNHQASAAVATLATAGNAKALAALPAADQVKAAASQFEAIMVRQFLQDSVGNLLGGESGGPGGSVYGYLLTDTLATKLTEGGGLGLGRMLQQQLTPRAAAATTPATTL
jgi:flagellar protein FlgJ